MGELEIVIGDLGVKQWVKNKFAAKIREFKGNDVDRFVSEFNQELLSEFTAVARGTIDELIKKVSEALDEKE